MMPRAALIALCAVSAASAEKFPSEFRLESETKEYSVYETRFPTAIPSPFAANNTVWGRLYVPAEPQADGRRPPCIVLLPIMAAPNLWIETRFASSFARRRMAVFLIEMPYQFHRRPDALMPNGEVLLARSPGRMRKNIQQSVADVRRAVTWLEASGKVDKDRIAVFGISLGAVVGASALSQDGRLKAGIFLLGGADIPGILMSGAETRDIAAKMSASPAAIRGIFRGIDPLDYRESNRGKRVLLINALWDQVVPARYGRKLAQAFPGCRQIWVPSGHYSAMLHLFWVRPYVAGTFRKWFAAM